MKAGPIDRDPCAGRHRGADTSDQAFRTTSDSVRKAQKTAIVAFIRAAGDRGATADETETALGLPHQSASARVSELVRAGEIHYREGVTRLTARGKKARVYFIGAPPAMTTVAIQGPPVNTDRAELDEAYKRHRSRIWLDAGAHEYPGVAAFKRTGKLEDFFTSDCAHGCGAWMGGSASGGPDGVDPFGDCPKAKPQAPPALAPKEPEPAGKIEWL